MYSFTLSYVPFPVSVNASTKNVGPRGRAKSQAYKFFEKEMWVWNALYKDRLAECRRFIHQNKKNNFLQMYITLVMPRNDIFTKKATIRKIDASNFIKTLEDSLTKILGFDDSEIFEVSISKEVNMNELAKKRYCTVTFSFKPDINHGGNYETKQIDNCINKSSSNTP